MQLAWLCEMLQVRHTSVVTLNAIPCRPVHCQTDLRGGRPHLPVKLCIPLRRGVLLVATRRTAIMWLSALALAPAGGCSGWMSRPSASSRLLLGYRPPGGRDSMGHCTPVQLFTKEIKAAVRTIFVRRSVHRTHPAASSTC